MVAQRISTIRGQQLDMRCKKNPKEVSRLAAHLAGELSVALWSGAFRMKHKSFKRKARGKPGRSQLSRMEGLYDPFHEIRDEVVHGRGFDQSS